MKKQIIVAFALLIGVFSFAQKKELKAVEKAIKNNNFAEAKTVLGQVESLISSADDKTKSKYYFLLGQALYANGTGSDVDVNKAIESFDMSGSTFGAEISQIKTTMLQSLLTEANDNLEAKKYVESSKGFEKAYKLSKKDTLYLYYAASTAVNGQDFDIALGLYEQLKDLGYTGIANEYVAVEKETGKEISFSSKQMMDLSVKAGSHIRPEARKTKSAAAEIVKNIALIYIANGDNEKASEAIKDARAANPDDLGLLLSDANIQLKMGNKDKFKTLIEEATLKDPNNAELQFNLGVVSAESGDFEGAKKYYNKAIEIDSNYSKAQINMAALILDKDQDLLDQMNALGTSSADNRKYDELTNLRTENYKKAIPYLEAAFSSEPNSYQIAKTLLDIYGVVGDTAKFKALKAKVDAMPQQ